MSAHNQPRTSIIMPVYNTGKSVLNAISSVQAQTDADWELIVIVDASPDDAKDRISNYLASNPDSRVKPYYLEVNGGVSAARNVGLENAKGEWIAFLDSDDAFEPLFLERMHTAAVESEADIVVCAHTLVPTQGEERVRSRVPAQVCSGREAALMLLKDSFTPYLWDKIFRKETVAGSRFATDIRRAEDALFVLNALINAKAAASIDSALYRYTVDQTGLTWGRVTPVEESDALVSHFRETVKLLAPSNDVNNAFVVSKVLTYLNNAQQVLVGEAPDSEAILAAIRSRISISEVMTCLKVRPVFGAAGLLLKMSPSAYRVLYGEYVKRRYGIAQ